MKFVIKKSLADNLKKKFADDKLKYFKSKIMKILDSQDDFIEKGKLATVGEIRVWNGKKYKKMPDKKWVRVFDSQNKHTEISIARLKGKVKRAESVEELYNIVMNNIHRFTDSNGNILPIVEELKKEVNAKKLTLKNNVKHTKSNKINSIDDCTNINEVNDFINKSGLFFEKVEYPKNCMIVAKDIYRKTSIICDRFPILKGNLPAIKVNDIDESVNGWFKGGYINKRGIFLKKENTLIELNKKYFNDDVILKENEKMKGSEQKSTENITDSIFHENGHFIAGVLNSLIDRKTDICISIKNKVINTLYSKKERDTILFNIYKEIRTNLSLYGCTNPEEFVAEGIREYLGSENPRPMAKLIGEQVEKLLKDNIQGVTNESLWNRIGQKGRN